MSRCLRYLLAFCPMALLPPAFADVDNTVRDLAARIDFGWFTSDRAMIAAAGRSLEADSADPWRSYLRAYGAYRMALLQRAQGTAASASIEICEQTAEQATAEGQVEVEVEANVLLAACAALAAADEPLRSLLHRRRFHRALARAETLQRDNPRLLLVALQSVDMLAEGTGPEPQVMLAAFRRQDDGLAFPDWGEAEAMILLAKNRLAAGDLRAARDLVEEALLLAPTYAAALALERQVSGPSPDD